MCAWWSSGSGLSRLQGSASSSARKGVTYAQTVLTSLRLMRSKSERSTRTHEMPSWLVSSSSSDFVHPSRPCASPRSGCAGRLTGLRLGEHSVTAGVREAPLPADAHQAFR